MRIKKGWEIMKRGNGGNKDNRYIQYISFGVLIFGLFLLGFPLQSCQKKSEGKGTTGTGNETNFANPDDAITEISGSLSVSPANSIITGSISTEGMITGRMITGRIITGRMMAPQLKLNHENEIDILNIFVRENKNKNRFSKKQTGVEEEEFELSCDDIKPQCVEGKVEKQDCNVDQSKTRLNFDIELKDCKEMIDEEKGDFIVSTGHTRGYVEVSTSVLSSGSGEINFIFYIDEDDSLVKEFRDNKEVKRVKMKASKYKDQLTYVQKGDNKELELKIILKVSGSYSTEDQIGNRKEEYSYNDFAVELTGKISSFEGGQSVESASSQFYLSIVGGYSINTEPQSCVEGVFYYKTIKPIRLTFGEAGAQGYCGIDEGEIEVNNARIEFSKGKVKVVVEKQEKEYSCEEIGGLCRYDQITIAEGIEKVEEEEGEGVCPVWYKDEDGDGYTEGITKVSCEQLTGYVKDAKSGDCNDNDKDINPATTEICDGKDNDCNGQVDEGFNVGQSCSVGVGECARTGQLICKADGSGTECNASPGSPTTEICDGKDNDCDGQTDENNVCAPVTVTPRRVGAGGDHTCAIKQDGSLWCWGSNDSGQLGDGTNADRNAPVQITYISGVSSVALGDHTCAIKQDGSLWCWGRNDSGQLGDGTNTDKNAPVQIMSSGVVAVSLGGAHTCAVKQDGSLWCWGANYYGQLGDGTAWRESPTYIMNLGSGGSAPYIVKISGEFEQISGKEIREQGKYGCSSANFAYSFIYLMLPVFILFALRKFKPKSNK